MRDAVPDTTGRVSPIRLLIVGEEHTMPRASLHRYLELDPTLRVVGEAAEGSEALALARRQQPDVVILYLPAYAAVGIACLLNEVAPACRVILLSTSDDPALRRVTERLGVQLLSQYDPPTALQDAIHRVTRESPAPGGVSPRGDPVIAGRRMYDWMAASEPAGAARTG